MAASSGYGMLNPIHFNRYNPTNTSINEIIINITSAFKYFPKVLLISFMCILNFFIQIDGK